MAQARAFRSLRLPYELDQRMERAAKAAELSVNEWLTRILEWVLKEEKA